MTAHRTTPTEAQIAWQKTEMNLFVHFGMNSFFDRDWGDGQELPSQFNPAQVDCAQWARVARECGFQMGILTAKHHDGFCLWPSETTEHSVKSSPWRDGKGDLVREFVDAFRAEGLKVGLYLSPWDRHDPSYGDSPAYNDLYSIQLTELLTNYGELHEVWFDGACAIGPNGRKQEYDWDRFFAIVKDLQPNAVTFGDGGTDVRWVGNERGYAAETCWSTINPETIRFPGDSGICEANDARAQIDLCALLEGGEPPDGRQPLTWRPAECDVSIRPSWFYRESENTSVRSTENLIDLYFNSVGRNSLLLLNIPPTREGLFHDVDVQALRALRHQLDRLFERNFIDDASLRADSESSDHPVSAILNQNSFWSADESATRATIEIRLAKPELVSVVSIQEPIRQGQRIAAYSIEAEDDSGQWMPVSRGTTVGYKKLDRINPTKTSAIRIHLEQSFGSPALASIGLY